MKADIAFEELERHGRKLGGLEHLLDGAANILGGIQQSAVDIEQINREGRNGSEHVPDHAGWGRSPSESPVTRRGVSGRSTCWV